MKCGRNGDGEGSSRECVDIRCYNVTVAGRNAEILNRKKKEKKIGFLLQSETCCVRCETEGESKM